MRFVYIPVWDRFYREIGHPTNPRGVDFQPENPKITPANESAGQLYIVYVPFEPCERVAGSPMKLRHLGDYTIRKVKSVYEKYVALRPGFIAIELAVPSATEFGPTELSEIEHGVHHLVSQYVDQGGPIHAS